MSQIQNTALDTGKFRGFSQSCIPICSVAGLFFTSAFIPPNPRLPPFIHRFGFAGIFAGAGYVISTGDSRNGSGIATAWSLIYLFLNSKKAIMAPRHPISLGLTFATTASAALYGTEYFFLQGDAEEDSEDS